MEATSADRLEKEISRLPIAEQRGLIDRVVQKLRVHRKDVVDEKLLEAMAADPEIQAENRAIARDFATTEADGLHLTGA